MNAMESMESRFITLHDVPTTGDAQTLLDFYVFCGPDSDDDGLPDFVEKHFAQDRLSSNAAMWLDFQGDLDGDGVRSLSAYSFDWDLRANARQYDLDGDGMADAQEDYWAGLVPGLLNKAVFSDAVTRARRPARPPYFCATRDKSRTSHTAS